MEDRILHTNEMVFNSYLSFKPLVSFLKKNIAEGNRGLQKLYGQVVVSFEKHPDLLGPVTDLSQLSRHSELIEELLSAVFPPTTANFMYGVSVPFQYKVVYTSPLFKTLLMRPGTSDFKLPNKDSEEILEKEKIHFACGLILKKYLGFNNPEQTSSIYPFKDAASGINRYMELRLDGRFIDVKPLGEMPTLPESILDPQTYRLFTMEELIEMVPLDKFVFEGITPMRVNDVTETAVITEIKNRLLNTNSLPDNEEFKILEGFIESLIGLRGLSIGITPFFKINEHYIYSDLHNNNSILFRQLKTVPEKDEISDYCKLLFRENSKPALYEALDELSANEIQSLRYYFQAGGRSLIICPLKQNKELIGMLEIVSKIPGQLKPAHISKIEATIPLFTLRLEKTLEQLNNQVDRIIKKKFTAVQPAVEWKFTETALTYIADKLTKQNCKIEKIAFKDVFPLYGAIDVRNSSTERSHAIQLDLLEQLSTARKIIKKAQTGLSFPLLQEIDFKIDKHIESASDVLQSEEELGIQDFLQTQLVPVLHHLLASEPLLKNEVEDYFSLLDPKLGIIYHHRRGYEESISRINETLAGLIDKEQLAAQKVYPHFFERYVTDGLDFNIFIGQSISPRKKFDEIYLKNLKMWQLTVLVKAAGITHQLEKELSHSLRTTQLILSHSQPLSISFRTEERKFDVDGAYNTRYEIIKKRIDKVRIKETNERLTQPGKIAIVYSQTKDADEYTEYIEFLQNKKLLKPGIEKHDLEELQGVIGLKALRVDVCFDDESSPGEKIELSNTTSQQLLDS